MKVLRKYKDEIEWILLKNSGIYGKIVDAKVLKYNASNSEAVVDCGYSFPGVVNLGDIPMKYKEKFKQKGGVAPAVITSCIDLNHTIKLSVNQSDFTRYKNWNKFRAFARIGQVVDGVIVENAPYGIVLKQISGIPGVSGVIETIHITGKCKRSPPKIGSWPQVNDRMQAIIMDFDDESTRVKLSLYPELLFWQSTRNR